MDYDINRLKRAAEGKTNNSIPPGYNIDIVRKYLHSIGVDISHKNGSQVRKILHKHLTSTSLKPTRKPINKPTRKPINKPTRKPINKPTRKPINKPTRKPINKPTRKPTLKPARKPFNKHDIREELELKTKKQLSDLAELDDITLMTSYRKSEMIDEIIKHKQSRHNINKMYDSSNNRDVDKLFEIIQNEPGKAYLKSLLGQKIADMAGIPVNRATRFSGRSLISKHRMYHTGPDKVRGKYLGKEDRTTFASLIHFTELPKNARYVCSQCDKLINSGYVLTINKPLKWYHPEHYFEQIKSTRCTTKVLEDLSMLNIKSDIPDEYVEKIDNLILDIHQARAIKYTRHMWNGSRWNLQDQYRTKPKTYVDGWDHGNYILRTITRARTCNKCRLLIKAGSLHIFKAKDYYGPSTNTHLMCWVNPEVFAVIRRGIWFKISADMNDSLIREAIKFAESKNAQNRR